MADNSSPDYKALYLKEHNERNQAIKRQEQAEEELKQIEQRLKQVEERNQPTHFDKFIHGSVPMESSKSDSDQTTSSQERNLNQITSSPPTQRLTHEKSSCHCQASQIQQHTAEYCTQKCLLGLQRGDILDSNCPNVKLHRQDQASNQHLITAERLIQLLKQQLDEDLDHNCTPFGVHSAYGEPFKITCVAYGYTVVGKGTTSHGWKEVSREADVYHILKRAQGSAVPVFLGTIDMKMCYFLHRRQIRHMLIMAWGGKVTSELERTEALVHEIRKSGRDIRALGVMHRDLRYENVLWNAEVGRALIIDFHKVELVPRSKEKQAGSLKRRSHKTQDHESKRLQVIE
jgi:hypothetical protein